MRVVQMTLDEDLLQEVDLLIKRLHTTRSAFARDALRSALEKYAARQLEIKHRRGYEQNAVREGEFSDWEDEQVWGNA